MLASVEALSGRLEAALKFRGGMSSKKGSSEDSADAEQLREQLSEFKGIGRFGILYH